MGRWMGVLVFWLAATAAAAADGSPVARYLVDGRVHVTVVYRTDGTAGELAWRDTVTGRAGDTAFRVGEDGLQLAGPQGFPGGHARLVPAVALVLERPPWDVASERPALGVCLD